MLTLGMAKRLTPGQILYQPDHFNTNGSRRRWSVSGQVKLYKRDVTRVHVPLKRGLYSHDFLGNSMFLNQGYTSFVSLEEDSGSERAAVERHMDTVECHGTMLLVQANWFQDHGKDKIASELRAIAEGRHVAWLEDEELWKEKPNLFTGLPFYMLPRKALTWPDGTWLESEEFCYPAGGFTRRALAKDEAGRPVLCKCSIPDTYFSIPARFRRNGNVIRGFLSSSEEGLTFTQFADQNLHTRRRVV